MPRCLLIGVVNLVLFVLSIFISSFSKRDESEPAWDAGQLIISTFGGFTVIAGSVVHSHTDRAPYLEFDNLSATSFSDFAGIRTIEVGSNTVSSTTFFRD